METRKERYSKYREQIRHMREEDFPKGKRGEEGSDDLMSASGSEGASVVSQEQPGSMLPYDLYLRHRHRMLAFKFVALFLAIAGFVVWWVLMQRR